MFREDGTAYQATDLARSHREVIDAARHGGALIRDKDGLALILKPAEEIARTEWIVDVALDVIRSNFAPAEEDERPESVASYGRFGWLSVLPPPSRKEFLRDVSRALLLTASGLSTDSVEQVIDDWRATAETWADVDAREQLLEEMNAPGRDL